MEANMSEDKKPESSLTEEFRSLGKNLIDAAHATWDSPERQKLQKEIEDGMLEFRDAVNKEAEHWNESPTAQRLRADAENLGERVRSSEIEGKIRDELLIVLKSANLELENLANRWSPAQTSEDDDETETPREDADQEEQ
jgi:hypothetical protein